jgi:HSP20 family molecular chaperone IbpA
VTFTLQPTTPEAEEGISWGEPFYKYHGELAGFAAYKNHVSFGFGAAVLQSKDRKTLEKKGYKRKRNHANQVRPSDQDTLIDVIDSGKEYIVKAELPGLKKENVEIEVGTNELSLTAKSDIEREEKGQNYLHRERAFSTFRRYIGLAESIDTGKVSASMADGILEVKLPKLEPEPEKKRRKITPE